ncbi:hypothetical protein N6H14_15140 [Paenibacillus sp. CC-CFT747]|nr:hypothetical protein N6H14_15140 [Paenibacillus sp. CC-CFT747]
MRIKITRFNMVLSILLFLSACSSKNNEITRGLSDIRDVFNSRGVWLKEELTDTNDFVLNGIKPNGYKLENGEHITFYIFNSEKQRQKGLEDFNNQKAQYDMAAPLLYEVKNVLIVYWYRGEPGSKTQYDENIKKAVEGLEVLQKGH